MVEEEAYNEECGSEEVGELDEAGFDPFESERFLASLQEEEEWFGEDKDISREDEIIRKYIHEIGEISFLSKEEEHELMSPVEEQMRKWEVEKEVLSRSPRQRKSSREAFRKEYLACVQPRIKKLVRANLRLVVSIAKKYQRNRTLSLLDLIQEGNIGLMTAAERYKPSKGYKFSTYATWWIRQAIARALADCSRTIRVPVHALETLNKMNKMEGALRQELERDPMIEETSTALQLPVEKLVHLRSINEDPISFDWPVNPGDEDSDDPFYSYIEDLHAISPEDAFADQELTSRIDQVLSTLTPREEKVIRMRLGIGEKFDHTLEEAGQVFGVTRERIRQIESRALKKLKDHSDQIS